MSEFRRIMVGYNFSPDGEHALQTAALLAERQEAVLALVHVIEPVPFPYHASVTPSSAGPSLVEAASRMRAELTAVAERRLPYTLPVTIEVPTGKPFVSLIRACRSWRGDLIVIGGYHEPALSRTSLAVVRTAPVSVLVAKQQLASGPQTILIPIDFSACAKRAATVALDLVQTFGGRVVFLHVIDTHLFHHAHYRARLDMPTPRVEDVEPEWRTFLSELSLGDVAWEKRTVIGWATETITTLATDLGAGLIVMGTHGRTHHTEPVAHTLLGGVAETTLQQATASVLTVRPEAFHFALP